MPDQGGFTLGFDTSAAHCAAAVVSQGRVLAHCNPPMARGQAERLFPLLEEVLAEAGIGWRDLAAIGVGIGPGNFTGIRIAVAAARGLALSLDVPAIGVSATEAAAAGVPRPCRAVVELRGDEVAWQDFRDGAEASRPALSRRDGLPPGPLPLTPRWPAAAAIALIAAAQAKRSATGARPGDGLPAGAGRFDEANDEDAQGSLPRGSLPRAGMGSPAPDQPDAPATRVPVDASRTPDGPRPGRPAPLYLRAADASPPREAAPVILP